MAMSFAPPRPCRAIRMDGSLPGVIGLGAARLRAAATEAERRIATAGRPGGLDALAAEIESMAAQVASINAVLTLDGAEAAASRAVHGGDLATALRALIGAGEAAQATAEEACRLLDTRRRARA